MRLRVGSAAEQWADELARWRIPDAILAKAPEDPWRIPPALFALEAETTLSPSHRRALEALPAGGTVLDVGAGGGAMSRPLRQRASCIAAVDTSAAMLGQCDADVRLEGLWPDVTPAGGVADVVVYGHVVYNVADIEPFLAALTAAARRRVVLELTAAHHSTTRWRSSCGARSGTWSVPTAHAPSISSPSSPRWESPPARSGGRGSERAVQSGSRRGSRWCAATTSRRNKEPERFGVDGLGGAAIDHQHAVAGVNRLWTTTL
jgi:hypothetical protein